jgi:hypothetical protein
MSRFRKLQGVFASSASLTNDAYQVVTHFVRHYSPIAPTEWDLSESYLCKRERKHSNET